MSQIPQLQAYLRGFPGAATLFAAAGMPGFPGNHHQQRERSRSPIRDDRQEEHSAVFAAGGRKGGKKV